LRFTTFRINGKTCWGRVERDHVVPLDHEHPSLKVAIEKEGLSGQPSGPSRHTSLRLDEIEFLPVLPDPTKILCVGLNYQDHRRETGRAEVDHPAIFIRFADSQTGHRTSIRRPRESTKLDYEGELAVVIGKAGRRIPAPRALEYVAGYSCYNDASIRDWQAHTTQVTSGKNFPETGAFGPWLVTPDEFGVPEHQTLRTRLNGRVMQEARLAQMIFPISTLIEYCSSFTALLPGDVIITGTPGGVGFKRNPPVFMAPGDRIEVEIDGIGILENHIVGDTAAA
jgi:2-keto-4-pentenoate hydratase/2-oxohepta-3-ene-1,7-dioic acid hydratase in catechol pathway